MRSAFQTAEKRTGNDDSARLYLKFAASLYFIRVIGQKVLIKTAAIIEKSMVVAVLSCSKQLTGWTESVDKTT